MKTALLISLLLPITIAAQQPIGAGIKELATQITASATRQEKQKIAVLPFHELDGQPTVLGTYVAEELVTNLFQLGNFKIVERGMLDKLLGEQKLQQTGAIDPATAKEIGRIAAVDAIVTGSITDMESFVAVNCRLIDTTTGEVFGAAQTKITKDDDVRKIMRFALTPDGTQGTRTTHERANAIATKDLGPLRVTLKSVLPVRRNTRSGYPANGIMCTFDVMNREARQPVVVAVNANAWEEDNWPRGRQSVALRAGLLDERGGVWTMSSVGLGGIGFVRAGVHGRDGREAYAATEIVRLLRLRDDLGRDSDDPADGTSDSNSAPLGGRVRGYPEPGDTTPRQTFFPWQGNRFISGATTAIEPGASITVTMTFEQEGGQPTTAPTFFQFDSEIVVGVGQAGTKRSYALHTLSFDRISMPAVGK
ncbi:MAG TPA: FlgO family outer membrane protein [Thermoanaerobaculia bacterium]|nr:FlgO family outer membrane protein [Thermoanaerobaculia bacterium]